MAGLSWLTVAISALPHITDLVKASKELLKNRKPTPNLDLGTIDANDPLANIVAACENNAESIRLLTEQMQNQLQHFQTHSQELEKRLRRLKFLSGAALVLAAVACGKLFNLF